jgi:hypothetical protein
VRPAVFTGPAERPQRSGPEFIHGVARQQNATIDPASKFSSHCQFTDTLTSAGFVTETTQADQCGR